MNWFRAFNCLENNWEVGIDLIYSAIKLKSLFVYLIYVSDHVVA